jgi:hypothetical protein
MYGQLSFYFTDKKIEEWHMGRAIAPDTGPVASGSFKICLLKIVKHQNMFMKLNHREFVHTVFRYCRRALPVICGCYCHGFIRFCLPCNFNRSFNHYMSKSVQMHALCYMYTLYFNDIFVSHFSCLA